MNCNDYLSMLESLPVEELSYGHAREHAAGCRDCDRVTRVVVERERNMMMAYGDVHSSVPAAHTSAHALRLSRRRRVALYYKVGLGLAMVATLLTYVVQRGVPAPPRGMLVTEIFRLQCLSPEQAAELVRPFIGASGRAVMRPQSPLGILTVEAPPHEMAQVQMMISQFDSPTASQCAVQVRVPPAP